MSVNKKNALDFVYERNDDFSWKEEKHKVVIDVKNRGAFNRIAQMLFKRPKISHISLDEYGSVFWKNIDGVNSVFDIYNLMCEAFPDEKEMMLDRVLKFVKILSDNRYIRRVK